MKKSIGNITFAILSAVICGTIIMINMYELLNLLFLFLPVSIVAIFYYFVTKKRPNIRDEIKILYAISLSQILTLTLLYLVLLGGFVIPLMSVIDSFNMTINNTFFLLALALIPIFLYSLLLSGTAHLKRNDYLTGRKKLIVYYSIVLVFNVLLVIKSGFESFQYILGLLILVLALYKLFKLKALTYIEDSAMEQSIIGQSSQPDASVT